MTGKQTIFMALIVGVLAGASVFGAGLVVAAEGGNYAVRQVFAGEHDADHEALHEAMHGSHEARLDEAVADGAITEAQKKAILKKLDEIDKVHRDLKTEDHEARHETMEELHDDLSEWLKENDIDPGIIAGPGDGCGMMGGGEGMRHPGSMGH